MAYVDIIDCIVCIDISSPTRKCIIHIHFSQTPQWNKCVRFVAVINGIRLHLISRLSHLGLHQILTELPQTIYLVLGEGIHRKISTTWPHDWEINMVQVIAWCRQVPSYYLNQCWQNPLSSYGTRPQIIKINSRLKNIVYKFIAVKMKVLNLNVLQWWQVDQ